MAVANTVMQEVRGRSRNLGDTCTARHRSETSSGGERKTMLMITLSSGAAGAVAVAERCPFEPGAHVGRLGAALADGGTVLRP